MTLRFELDPAGTWRRNRFEFCNALEDAANRPTDPQPWQVLRGMGVTRSVAPDLKAEKEGK